MGIGIFLFLITVLVSGSASRIGLLSWWGVFALSAAGIIHFVIGRSCNYTSLRLIGANRTTPLMATNVLFAAAFALVFLNEPITPVHALGISSVFLGLVLIGASSGGTAAGGKAEKKTLFTGMAAGLGSGLCYGISPLFVSIGVREIGSPFAGGLVSYLAAGVTVMLLLVRFEQRRCLACLPRTAVGPMIIGGVAVGAAQIFRYVALGFTPVNVVTPLTATNNLFVPFLSFVVNRKIEIFSPKVLAGTVATVAGVFIVLLT